MIDPQDPHQDAPGLKRTLVVAVLWCVALLNVFAWGSSLLTGLRADTALLSLGCAMLSAYAALNPGWITNPLNGVDAFLNGRFSALGVLALAVIVFGLFAAAGLEFWVVQPKVSPAI